ncbi:MAG: tyrosine recombinase XerC [Betaproteobacteria bacterium]|nr:tyrosine recombinase XerC [Betaproteobacteria bacterium]
MDETAAPEHELPPLAEKWLRWMGSERRASLNTLASYRRDLQKLVALAAPRGFNTLSPHDIRRFSARLHVQGLSGRSLARTLSTWRGFYRWCVLDDKLDANPVINVRAPKSPKALPQVLSPDQAVAMLDAKPEISFVTRDRAMFELFYSSGLRVSELEGLDLGPALDLDEEEVEVIGKRNKKRRLPMTRLACAALRAWIAERPTIAAPEENALFVNARGRRLSVRGIQLALKDWARTSGLGVHVHPHMLRHSVASHLLQSSGDLRAVQELLGHASIASTQVYTHLDFQHLAQVYDAAHPRAHKKSE